MGKLDGKRALVTGGNTGIGRAICLAMAAEGADVAVNYIAKEEMAESLVRGIQAKGRRAVALKADVSDEGEVKGLVDGALRALGPIDILVNNAGVQQPRPFLEMTAADWDRMMAVHMRGTFLMCRYVAPHMVARKSGRIINMASQFAYNGREHYAHYSAAKGGILVFTRIVAKELGPHGITVNAVAPGYIDTGFDPLPEETKRRMAEALPLRRLGRPDDVAPMFVFLASDDAGYLTGQTLSPCGCEIMF